MSQKDTSTNKGKAPGSPTGKRGNTKYRMQAIEQETGKTTSDLTDQIQQVEATAKAASKAAPEPEGDSVRGLWKSKVLASYHGAASQPLPDIEQDATEAVHDAMIVIIDAVFDLFQNSAYEFNKIASGSELELNWVRPFLTKEGAPSWMGSNVEPVTVFTGRMSTRLWTLIMKGTTEVIQTYILPTNKLMTFNISSGTFKPYLQLEPFFEQGVLGWRLESHEISPALLQPIARELFNALIRFAKSEGREDEEFDLVSIGLIAPKPVEDPQVEIDRQRFYQQAFLEDLKSHLDTRREVRPADSRDGQANRSGPPPSEFNQPLPDHIRRELEVLRDGAPSSDAPGTVPNNHFSSGGAAWKSVADAPGEQLDSNISRQLHKMAEDATRNSSSAQPSQNLYSQIAQPRPQQQGQQPQQNAGTQPPAPPQVPLPQRTIPPGARPSVPAAPQQSQQPQQQRSPQNQPPSQEHVNQAMAAAQNAAAAQHAAAAQQAANAARPQQAVNLPVALTQLIASLEREMEVVAKAGADAFALRDLGRADAALKFSSRLSEYRQMSQELLDYYRRKR